MLSKHTTKKSNDLDDRLASLVGMAQNYKASGYSDVQALEAALGDYERSSGRNIGYATLERLYQALEARGFSFPEEELEEATTRGGTKVREHGMNKNTIEKIRTRESTGGRYTLEYVLYSRGDVYRKVGSFTAPSDQEACKKAAMIQANYGPLKDLDAEDRAELEEDVMRGFEEYLEQHSDPIEAWDSYITYNSEEFSVKLTAPDGRVLVDTGMDDFAEEEDFEDSPEDTEDEDTEYNHLPYPEDTEDEDEDLTPEERYVRARARFARDHPARYARALARYRRDQPGLSKLWGMPKEYLADEKDFEESKKTSIGNLLREAAKPVQEDKLGAWYKSAFTNDRKATENKEGFYQVRESHVAKKPRVKESVPNWYEFQSDVFNAINEVYEKYNMGNAAEKIDKMDMIKVLTEWISMVTETKKDEKLL